MATDEKPVLVDVREIGRKGGSNSRKNLTPKEAKAMAQNAAASRWAIYRKAHGAPLKPGDADLLKRLAKELGKSGLDRRIEAVRAKSKNPPPKKQA